MHNTVYLIYILGMAYCPQCFNEWQKNSHRYEDDIKLQNENHINWYKNHKFDVIEWIVETNTTYKKDTKERR